jgi:hypothetical protein
MENLFFIVFSCFWQISRTSAAAISAVSIVYDGTIDTIPTVVTLTSKTASVSESKYDFTGMLECTLCTSWSRYEENRSGE